MARTDTELLTAVRAGETAAVDELLARHEHQLYRFGLRMCGDEDAAREVLQETLLAAFKGLAGFRGDAQLSTWLYQIARSYCIKARRKHVGEPSQLDALDQVEVAQLRSEAPAADAQLHAREIGNALQTAIAALPPHYREVVVLKDVEGLSLEEMAVVLGEELAGVKSRLHRARLELRSHLAGLLGEGASGTEAPCPELAQELAAYAAQEIDQATCVRIEAHLSTCPRCAGACETLQKTVSLCRRIPGGEVPPAVRSAVRSALLAVVRQAS
jgi:RNA polymerase sigma-70 factor (ECF subfamily)